MKTWSRALAFGLILAASPLWATEAHVHGQARLEIISEGSRLMIRFSSPAANIVGFEHQPHDKQQQKQIEQAIAVLQAGERLFRFQGSLCTLQQAMAQTGLRHDTDHNHQHHDDKHKQHAHEHHSADQHHGHDNIDEHHKHGAHADFEAEYHFNCDRTDKLTGIELTMFKHFTGLEQITAILLLQGKQSVYELNAKQAVIIIH